VTFRRHFSYSKAVQYMMHSTGGYATSRLVSIIQARAFSTVRGSDVLSPNDFRVDLLVLCSVFWSGFNVGKLNSLSRGVGHYKAPPGYSKTHGHDCRHADGLLMRKIE